MQHEVRFCSHCATALEWIVQAEDGGDKSRLRCPACGWTHWNNPTPVLAAVVECEDRGGQVLLARNAAWPGKFFGLVTGFMEAGETPQEGVAREVVDAALAAVMEDEGVDDLTLVEAAAKKKLRSLARLEPDVQRRRLYGYLGRQGFPSALIHDVVRRLAGGPGRETSSGEE